MEKETKANDVNVRAQSFNDELVQGKKCEKCGHRNEAPLKKYQLGLGAVAFLMNDGRIGARPQLFDDSKKQSPENTPSDNSQTDTPKEVEDKSEDTELASA